MNELIKELEEKLKNNIEKLGKITDASSYTSGLLCGEIEILLDVIKKLKQLANKEMYKEGE